MEWLVSWFVHSIDLSIFLTQFVQFSIGSYYDFDSSQAEDHKAIMADQLCGMWYLQASGITEPVSK